MEIAAIHFPPTPDDTQCARLIELFGRVADLLAASDVQGVATTSLLMGMLCAPGEPTGVLFTNTDARAQVVARQADILAPLGYTSLLFCAADELGVGEHLQPEDLGQLGGWGVLVGSVGLSGKPLIGMRVDALRRELTESRALLSAACGYPVMALCPRADERGHSVDGLVLSEARRAGYTLVFQEGAQVIDARFFEAGAAAVALPQRTLMVDDHPFEVRKWVLGEGIARKVAAARYYAEGPMRLLRMLRT
ncbi:MAG: hypothetical protein H0U74_00540 [Bradymonadaceae bacterium]|nr:hypothetical protein [Lujinxingiaceae bacterium]